MISRRTGLARLGTGGGDVVRDRPAGARRARRRRWDPSQAPTRRQSLSLSLHDRVQPHLRGHPLRDVEARGRAPMGRRRVVPGFGQIHASSQHRLRQRAQVIIHFLTNPYTEIFSRCIYGRVLSLRYFFKIQFS